MAPMDTTLLAGSPTSIAPDAFLQFGAMGLLFAVLLGLGWLFNNYMKQRQMQHYPTPQKGEMGYNEQMARTIYDVNITLSKVATTNEHIYDQSKKQTEVLERLVRVFERNHINTDG